MPNRAVIALRRATRRRWSISQVVGDPHSECGLRDRGQVMGIPILMACARQPAGVDRRHGPGPRRARRAAARTALRTRTALPRVPHGAALPAPGAAAVPEAFRLVSALRPAVLSRRAAMVAGTATDGLALY